MNDSSFVPANKPGRWTFHCWFIHARTLAFQGCRTKCRIAEDRVRSAWGISRTSSVMFCIRVIRGCIHVHSCRRWTQIKTLIAKSCAASLAPPRHQGKPLSWWLMQCWKLPTGLNFSFINRGALCDDPRAQILNHM